MGYEKILKETPLRIRLQVYLTMDDYDNWDNGDYKGDMNKIKEKTNHLIEIFEKFANDDMPEKFTKL